MLENQIKDQERTIQDLAGEKSTLLKIKRQQESVLKGAKEDKDYFMKMNKFEEEIGALKESLKKERHI